MKLGKDKGSEVGGGGICISMGRGNRIDNVSVLGHEGTGAVDIRCGVEGERLGTTGGWCGNLVQWKFIYCYRPLILASLEVKAGT